VNCRSAVEFRRHILPTDILLDTHEPGVGFTLVARAETSAEALAAKSKDQVIHSR
jgi:hypothetical protein